MLFADHGLVRASHVAAAKYSTWWLLILMFATQSSFHSLVTSFHMPVWGLSFCRYTQPASSSMYTLADIFREELDLPIPDCPYTGYIPRRELPPPAGRQPEQDICDEACEPEYYADDELSAVHSPTPLEYGTDASDATVREERPAASEQLDEDRSAISSFSYYYYHNSDHQPPPQVLKMNSIVLRLLLKIVEDTPLTHAESWVRCKNWRYQTAKATGVTRTAQEIENTTLQSDADAPTPPPFSIFQILHDQPVDAVDKMKAVTDWQGAIARGSSIPSAPPSLVSYLARRRSSLASLAKLPNLDPDVDSAIAGIQLSSTACPLPEKKCLTVIDDADEPRSELRCIVDPCAAAQVTANVHELPALPSPKQEIIETEAVVDEHALQAETAVDVKEISQLQNESLVHAIELTASERGDEKAVIKETHFTPQMVRSMIDILTAPSADIQRLRSFWEGQR